MQRAARLIFVLLLTLAGGQAHPILQNPVWIESSPERVTLRLHVSVRELIVVQTDRTGAAATLTLEEAEDLAPKHSGYLLDHLQIRADGERLAGTVTAIEPPKVIGEGLEGPDRSHFVYHLEFLLPRPPATLTFSQNMCVEFPSAPGVPWDLSYAYRYGPPGETPRKFGPLLRDRPLTFTTGFVRVREPMPLLLLGLWAVFVLASVLGASALSPGSFAYIGSVILWAAGLLAAKYLFPGIPAWVLQLLCGATAILTAADNIHRRSSAAGRHRIVLLGGGCLFFGGAFGIQQRLYPALESYWSLLPLPAVLAAALLACGLHFLARRITSGTGTALIQTASLLCCLAAAWLMLRLLEVV